MDKVYGSDFLIERGERKIQIRAMQGEKETGHISVMAPIHIEGVYIEPEHRGTGLLKDLVLIAEAEAKQLGVDNIFAFAVDEQMESYISRLGYEKQSWTVWSKKCQKH